MRTDEDKVKEVEKLALGIHELIKEREKLEDERNEVQKKIDDHNYRIEEMRKLIGEKLK